MNLKRVRTLKEIKSGKGPVVYWMNRDQRAHDNWALIYAQKLAGESKSELKIIFSSMVDIPKRQYEFMLNGLEATKKELKDKNLEFKIIKGEPEEAVPDFINEHNINAVVTDFNPLKPQRNILNKVMDNTDAPFYEVDAHNIVPCWIASDKQEWAAYTIRPKINRLLGEFLEEYPEPAPVHTKITDFIVNRLDRYAELRNDPRVNFQSGLSPYLHFGQISPQRVALEVSKSGKNAESVKDFLEELIIRRELSDNFCFYNSNYDNSEGFPDWAKKTLDEHRNDIRPYIYTPEEFEYSRTHDDIWNAAQTQMVTTGKMHGYMRMYWGKKILEWTETPEQAMEIAIYLNDKYELDGTDPNGFTGIAWCIGGVHDRAWPSRPVFGKIRYMSYERLKKKWKNIG